MTIDIALLKEYVKLDGERLELQRKVEALKKQLDPMEQTLLEQFAEEGIQSIKANGRLAYLHPQLWARPKDGDYERACRYLTRYGLGEYVHRTFNVQTFSAYVRELEEQGEELNDHIKQAIDVTREFQIRTKQA